MTTPTGQNEPEFVEKRVRFFPNMNPRHTDFNDEQNYHLDRQRRLGRAVCSPGVVDGLQVALPDPAALEASVSPGTAIDERGRQIFLAQAVSVDLSLLHDPSQATPVLLVIRYRQLESDPGPSSAASRPSARWHELPQLELVREDEAPPAGLAPRLARLVLNADGTATGPDLSARMHAGLQAGGGLSIAEAAELKGGLAVEQGLKVSGGLNVADGPAVLGGALEAQGGAVVAGGLNVSGAAQLDDTLTVSGPVSVLTPGGDATGGDLTLGDRSGSNLRLGHDAGYSWVQSHGSKPLAINPLGNGVAIGATDAGGNALLVNGTARVSGSLRGPGVDYVRAQFVLNGGGSVRWTGLQQDNFGRLTWSQRFIAIPLGFSSTFGAGHININMPTGPVPLSDNPDGPKRNLETIDGATWVPLTSWEALYAVHTVGGDQSAVSFQIRHYENHFEPLNNWLLVAAVNGDDTTLKLGTGAIVAPRSALSSGGLVPTGTIVMWSGTSDRIPGGWALCDGANGTPNLRGRFIVGAGPAHDGQLAAYDPNTAGYADTHTHAIDVPRQNVVTGAAGGHSHTPPAPWYDRSLVGDVAAAGVKRYNSIDRGGPSVESVRTSHDGDHVHQLSFDIPPFASGPSGGHNRPAWFALCFIMKL